MKLLVRARPVRPVRDVLKLGQKACTEFNLSFGKIRHRQPQRISFQQNAQAENLSQFLYPGIGNECASIRIQVHQAFTLQVAQGIPYRDSADAKLVRQVLLLQLLSRTQFIAINGVAYIFGYNFRGGPVLQLRRSNSFRHRIHDNAIDCIHVYNLLFWVMQNRGALVSLSIALMLWSLTFPIVRAMLGEVPLEVILTLRFTMASLILFGFWLWKGKELPRGKDLWLTAFSGFCCVTGYQLLSTHGVRTVSSGPASVLVDTMPIFATVLSVLILKHRPKWRTWTGLGVALSGAVLIALGESGGRLEWNIGVGLLLMAALIFSFGTIAQKPLMKRYDSLGITAVSFAAGALAMVPFAPNLLVSTQQIASRHLYTIAFLAIGPGALAYGLWGHALSRMPVAKASASLLLIGPLTFLIAWLFFNEVPTAVSVFGATVSCCGVWLVHSDQHC